MNVDAQSSMTGHRISLIALFLGVTSMVVLIVSVLTAVFVESVGLVDFFSIVLILALAAVICGLIARGKNAEGKMQGSRAATAGMILGIVVLVLVTIARIAVFLFFLPWLGA